MAQKKSKRVYGESLTKWVRHKHKKVVSEPEEAVPPRITNDTVAEHREEVLSGARRFVYPLQQSRHKVVIISTLIIVMSVIGAVLFSSLLLYRYKSTSNFAYRISQIIPFPVANVDGAYVPYENYLFEVRNTLFYYRNHGQEGVDIDSAAGDELVSQIKQQALEKVKLDALAEKIARDNDIQVTEQEISDQIEVIRSQGGVGESEQVLEDILRDFYDWDIKDLRRTIRYQLIRQKLPRIVDTETVQHATSVLDQLRRGDDFAQLALDNSDDLLTKENDGIIGLISRTNTDLPLEFVDAAFLLDEGAATQDLVESEFGLHIIKVNSIQDQEREVAHILFTYLDIAQYLADQLEVLQASDYIVLE